MDQQHVPDSRAAARLRRKVTRLSERGARPRRIRRAVNRLHERLTLDQRRREQAQSGHGA